MDKICSGMIEEWNMDHSKSCPLVKPEVPKGMKTWLTHDEIMRHAIQLHRQGVNVVIRTVKHPKDPNLFRTILPGQSGYRKAPLEIRELSEPEIAKLPA